MSLVKCSDKGRRPSPFMDTFLLIEGRIPGEGGDARGRIPGEGGDARVHVSLTMPATSASFIPSSGSPLGTRLRPERVNPVPDMKIIQINFDSLRFAYLRICFDPRQAIYYSSIRTIIDVVWSYHRNVSFFGRALSYRVSWFIQLNTYIVKNIFIFCSVNFIFRIWKNITIYVELKNNKSRLTY